MFTLTSREAKRIFLLTLEQFPDPYKTAVGVQGLALRWKALRYSYAIAPTAQCSLRREQMRPIPPVRISSHHR